MLWCPKCKKEIKNPKGWWRPYDSMFALTAGCIIPVVGAVIYAGMKSFLDPPCCPKCGSELQYEVPKKHRQRGGEV